MSQAILTTYDSFQTIPGSNFFVRPPAPHRHSYTKIKRWWNKSYPSTLYEACAIVEIRDSLIIVSGQSSLRLEIDLIDGELKFSTNKTFPGDGNIKRILVCPKNELYNLQNYDDYYYDYTTKSIKKVTYGSGGLPPLGVQDDFIQVEGGGILMTQAGGYVLLEKQIYKDIVTEDLILHLDASSEVSYDKTKEPTKWKDISAPDSTKIGTLKSGINYDSEYGGFLRFSKNTWVDFPKDGDYELDKDPFSIACFFRVNQIGGSIIDFRILNNNADGFSFYMTEDEGIKLHTYSDIQGDYYQSSFKLTSGSWSHVCFTRKGDTLKVYLNGELKDSVSNSLIKDLNFTDNALRVGANMVNNGPVSDIGEILIYKKKELSAEEVLQNHNACMPRFMADTTPAVKLE